RLTRPPSSTRSPYTTLVRSVRLPAERVGDARRQMHRPSRFGLVQVEVQPEVRQLDRAEDEHPPFRALARGRALRSRQRTGAPRVVAFAPPLQIGRAHV